MNPPYTAITNEKQQAGAHTQAGAGASSVRDLARVHTLRGWQHLTQARLSSEARLDASQSHRAVRSIEWLCTKREESPQIAVT